MAVHLQLTTLPAELLIRIYEVLPSFINALRLRATCHTLYDVWTNHRTAIVNEIMINQFECYPYARQLLAKQRHGVPLHQRDMSDRDLSKLVQNARRVEEVIKDIERKLVPKPKVNGLPEAKRSTIYKGNDAHPPTLTHTERLRVIRACYQIWNLIYYPEKVLFATVFSMRPRELFYFHELVNWARVTSFPKNRWDTFLMFKASIRAVGKLYWDTYSCIPPRFRRLEGPEVPVELFVIWDHYQDNLKSLICKRPLSNLQWDVQAEPLEHLWDYEPGDELLVSNTS